MFQKCARDPGLPERGEGCAGAGEDHEGDRQQLRRRHRPRPLQHEEGRQVSLVENNLEIIIQKKC